MYVRNAYHMHKPFDVTTIHGILSTVYMRYVRRVIFLSKVAITVAPISSRFDGQNNEGNLSTT